MPTQFPGSGAPATPPPPPPPPAPVGAASTQATPPGIPATPPGGGWNQPPAPPGWNPGPGAPSGGGGGKGVWILLGVVVLVIALGVGTFFVVKGLSGDDDTTATDGESSQTDTPTDDTSTPTAPITADPNSPTCMGGKPLTGQEKADAATLRGGGLSTVKAPRVYRRFKVDGKVYSQDSALHFADGITSLSKLIDSYWVSGYSLGSLARSRGYTDPQQAAQTAMSCLVQSDNYSSFTGRTDAASEQIDVGGHDAWKIVSDVTVSNGGPSGIQGDHVVLVVVDTGDLDAFGFYLNFIPIGFDDLLGEQQQVTDALQVE